MAKMYFCYRLTPLLLLLPPLLRFPLQCHSYLFNLPTTQHTSQKRFPIHPAPLTPLSIYPCRNHRQRIFCDNSASSASLTSKSSSNRPLRWFSSSNLLSQTSLVVVGESSVAVYFFLARFWSPFDAFSQCFPSTSFEPSPAYLLHLFILTKTSLCFPFQLFPNSNGLFLQIGYDSLVGLVCLLYYIRKVSVKV